ncbi:uncharacterized protein VTP21DRAFT_3531 [Calcarisporiella thermophila]|uniref:uncharacterized protein n=1 Tax=Calcarisporiella thermophila TaxID=911321 RepID=UPI0037436493
MSTEYRKLTIKKYPRLPGRKTPEERYWRKFKSPILIKEYGPVTSVNFSPVAPYDFAVTSSARVQIYSSKTHSVRKTISRFKDVAYGASFRSDGRLLVAGDETGLVQVFDVNSRAILRTFREHKLPVHVTKFSPNKTSLLTCSDDKTVRVWDLATENIVHTFDKHTDYVRSGIVFEDNPHLVLSGAYDQTVRLLDLRSGDCAITMPYGAPVEDVVSFPGGGMVVAAGGPQFKVFDLLSGGRLLQTVSGHQKTVTSLCFDSGYSRLLTGSLDQHVKVYNVQDYRVVHSVKYSLPVLSVALSPDDSLLVTGMHNGLLSIRQRQVRPQEVARKRQAIAARGGTYQYFMRGQNHSASADDFLVEAKRRRRLRDYDRYLKAFQYGNALDAVLRTNKPALTTVSLLQELVHRDGLKQALSGRDDLSLEPVVQFLVRYINNPRYTSLLVDVANTVIDMYRPVLGQSPLIDELMFRLRDKVRQEIAFQKEVLKVVGSLEMLFSKSSSFASAPKGPENSNSKLV